MDPVLINYISVKNAGRRAINKSWFHLFMNQVEMYSYTFTKEIERFSAKMNGFYFEKMGHHAFHII